MKYNGHFTFPRFNNLFYYYHHYHHHYCGDLLTIQIQDPRHEKSLNIIHEFYIMPCLHFKE